MIPDGTDLKSVRRGLAGPACCYKYESEIVDLEPTAFQAKSPRAIEFNDSDYATEPDALLRSGYYGYIINMDCPGEWRTT